MYRVLLLYFTRIRKSSTFTRHNSTTVLYFYSMMKTKIDDKFNPDFILACTHTEMLKAIVAGEVNIKELAVRELKKRNPDLIKKEDIEKFVRGVDC
jgi:hypothetical protein